MSVFTQKLPAYYLLLSVDHVLEYVGGLDSHPNYFSILFKESLWIQVGFAGCSTSKTNPLWMHLDRHTANERSKAEQKPDWYQYRMLKLHAVE